MFAQLPYRLMAAIIDTSGLPNHGNSDPTASAIPIIINTVLAITASISVLMIVIGGFRYIIARGDPSASAQARNTVLYAVIGLIVTMAAFSIVTFVIKSIS